MKKEKIETIYDILFSVVGGILLAEVILLTVFFLGSLGHDLSPEGKVLFEEEDILIEPPIDCLSFSDKSAQVLGNRIYVDTYRCKGDVMINGDPISSGTIYYKDGVISAKINDNLITANPESNILEFVVMYQGKESVVKIRTYIGEKRFDSLEILSYIPPLALVILIISYVIIFRKKKK